MAKRNPSANDDGLPGDRLQPSLLDLLEDDDPSSRSEAPHAAVMTRSRLRFAVRRDLGDLLNATNLEAEIDFEGYPHARASTLNFGVPPFAGTKVSDAELRGIDQTLRDAIIIFEPRLLPDTLQVIPIKTDGLLATHNELAFELRAKLWWKPHPFEVVLRSSLNLETREVKLKTGEAAPNDQSGTG